MRTGKCRKHKVARIRLARRNFHAGAALINIPHMMGAQLGSESHGDKAVEREELE